MIASHQVDSCAEGIPRDGIGIPSRPTESMIFGPTPPDVVGRRDFLCSSARTGPTQTMVTLSFLTAKVSPSDFSVCLVLYLDPLSLTMYASIG